MFRKILFILLFTSSCQLINAQNFNAGLIGGLSTTQVKGDQLSGFNKAGIIAGGFVNRSLSEKTALQMEIIFIQKGSRKPIDPDNGNHFYVMRLSYFEVPVLFQLKIKNKLIVETGPSFGALIFSEEEDEYGVRGDQPPFNKFELGGNIGLGYPLSDKFLFDMRFSSSLLTIRPFPGVSTDFFNEGQYNTVLAWSFHYQF